MSEFPAVLNFQPRTLFLGPGKVLFKNTLEAELIALDLCARVFNRECPLITDKHADISQQTLGSIHYILWSTNPDRGFPAMLALLMNAEMGVTITMRVNITKYAFLNLRYLRPTKIDGGHF